MLKLILHLIRGPLRSRESLILENVALRHQLQVWILLSRVWQGWRSLLVIVQPETVIRWHRRGFRTFWKRKSPRRSQGRPRLSRHERELIQQMVANNPIWGVPRIHGELLKLDIELSPTTVARYAARRRPPSQGWKTFLSNHSHEIVSVDVFTVPTITCQVLHVFLMVENLNRRIVHFTVTADRTMEWTSRQLVEAFPWDTAPTYMLRDRDHIYGRVFGAMNESRTHLGLEKECPVPRAVEPPEIGPIRMLPILGGLHHRHFREAAQMVNSGPDGIDGRDKGQW
jgi:hypothetical protein